MKTDGTLACWGPLSDARLQAPAGTFSKVATGADHSCALRVDDTVVCWGWDDSDPETLPPDERFVDVSSGGHYSCASRSNGTVACWGYISR